jgi:hypothetical protein
MRPESALSCHWLHPSARSDSSACITHDATQVVLVLDNREQFGRYRHGGHDVSAHGAGREVSAALLRAKGVSVEERALPIGDVTWVAR